VDNWSELDLLACRHAKMVTSTRHANYFGLRPSTEQLITNLAWIRLHLHCAVSISSFAQLNFRGWNPGILPALLALYLPLTLKRSEDMVVLRRSWAQKPLFTPKTRPIPPCRLCITRCSYSEHPAQFPVSSSSSLIDVVST